MADDFRDKPTRDVCNDEITILLVGKPSGILDFSFERSDVETVMMGKGERMIDRDK
jgi:hypothetical protein